ncbi:MAG: MrtP family glutamic-type intramembrane protease [Myxococcota bacterium]|nr:MrtP family glutamic-type intramembrane protease [Myxococcota bacterium]
MSKPTTKRAKSAHLDKKSIRSELFWVVGLTLVVTGGLAAAQFSIGWIREYILAAVAALFLYLPLEVLHKKGIDPADFGISSKPVWRSIKHAICVSMIIFPGYFAVYHVWQTQWLNNQVRENYERLDKWPMEIQDRPKVADMQEGAVRLYTEGELFWIRWHLPPGQQFHLRAKSDAVLETHVSRPYHRSEKEIKYRGPSDGRVAFKTSGQNLTLNIQAGGDELPADRLKLGASLKSADENPISFHRSYWWIINLLLVQFLLVALPEEVFYRGYLQTRLDQLFPKQTKVMGVDVSVMSLFLTSLIFAVGHYVTVPSPHRLAVFFPSLLFGWMRKASGGILAPLIFHALCNLAVEFASMNYH